MSAVYQVLPTILDAGRPLTIVEIGAHHGQDTAALRMVFPTARMWAFEPDPRNVYRLRRSEIAKSVTIVDAAIGDHEGKAEFLLSSGTPPKGDRNAAFANPKEPWSFSSSLKKPVKHLELAPWAKFDQKVTVNMTTLDAFAAREGIESIDFIWADVQGAEDQMIAGGQKALAKTSYLFTEYADVEIYQGQIGLAEILRRLPGGKREGPGQGAWEVVADYGEDVLLRNTAWLEQQNPRGGTGKA